MAGDMADSIEWFAADYDLLGDGVASECATPYWSPCCSGGIYAHFINDDHIGFQCCDCGKDFPKDYGFDQ